MEHVGLDPQRVHVVPNGVDPLRFRPRQPGQPGAARPGELVVAWIGSVEPVKGLDVLVDALAAVEGVRVLLAGDGPSRDALVARLAAAGLTDRVELLGRVANPEEVLERADALLLTSLAESCPMVLLQAMAAGLPALATTVGGVPEVLREGREGLLVPAGDAAQVATALSVLRDDPERRRAMGTAARDRVLAGYTLDHCLDRLTALYAQEAPCAC